jgi:hypothetical protein
VLRFAITQSGKTSSFSANFILPNLLQGIFQIAKRMLSKGKTITGLIEQQINDLKNEKYE